MLKYRILYTTRKFAVDYWDPGIIPKISDSGYNFLRSLQPC